MALKKKRGEEEEQKEHSGTEEHEEAAEEGEGNWLVSYADMMTLLCGFFIMLFSMATLDKPKYEGMAQALAEHFQGTFKSPSQELQKFVSQILQEIAVEKSLVVTEDNFGVNVAFQSTLFFDSLSSVIKPEGKKVLHKLIDGLGDFQEQEGLRYRFVVEGHTDSRPIVSGVYPSNWELSGSRASSVVRLFLDKGYRPEQMTAIAFADTRPIVPNRGPDGRYSEESLAKNRRVVIRILMPNADGLPIDGPGSKIEQPSRAPASAGISGFLKGAKPPTSAFANERMGGIRSVPVRSGSSW